MAVVWRAAVIAVVGYLLGSVPFAVIVSKVFWGIDVRRHGSGNTGATNVLRVFGVAPGVLVLVLDAMKGAAAVLFAQSLAFSAPGVFAADWLPVLGATAAIAGHVFSPFLGWRGGKGVATAAGVIVVIAPHVVLYLIVMFLIIVAITRTVSIGSVSIAIAFPLMVIWRYPDRSALLVFALCTAVTVVWRHRANMVRIVHGEETKIDFKRRLFDSAKHGRDRTKES